jgi:hypothetical protein
MDKPSLPSIQFLLQEAQGKGYNIYFVYIHIFFVLI